jgi:hypothetical protein
MYAMRNRNAPHIDFGFLRGVISSNPNFLPSNIDMVMERRGQFLFGEWKREDEEMKEGQKRLLKELAWSHKVLLITGYVDDQPHIELIQQINPTGTMKVVGKSTADLMKYIRDWYYSIEDNND